MHSRRSRSHKSRGSVHGGARRKHRRSKLQDAGSKAGKKSRSRKSKKSRKSHRSRKH